MRSAAWALATSSRCSASVSAAILVVSSVTSSRTFGQRVDPLVALGGQRVAAPRRHADRRTEPLRQAAAGLGHRGRDGRGVLTGLARPLGPTPGLAFGGGRAAQRIRPSPNGIRALLGGAHGQPGLDLGGPRGFGRRDGFLAFVGRGVEQRRLLGVGQALLELGQFLDGLPAARLELVALPDQPLPFLVGRAGVLPEPAELLVDRRDRGVGLVERGQRLLGGVLAGRLFGQRTGQGGAQLAALRLRGGELVAGLLDFGGDLQRARLAVRATADPARADQIAVDGDGAQLRPWSRPDRAPSPYRAPPRRRRASP